VNLLLNRLHHPVRVLGPGVRAGIWLQGCTIRCPGCMSTDTWGAAAAQPVEVHQVLDWLAGLPQAELEGITISGGEPTEQPEALSELLSGIARWRGGRPVDVLLFTGREPAWVRAHADLLRGADAVMAGPFRADLAGESPLRGSENQELILFSDVGEQAYRVLDPMSRRSLQVEMDDDGLWLIGIPLPGGLDALDDVTAETGLAWRARSWRR
jgi:anaerobic ribonucleoside-triphosphate reductase activating protein